MFLIIFFVRVLTPITQPKKQPRQSQKLLWTYKTLHSQNTTKDIYFKLGLHMVSLYI